MINLYFVDGSQIQSEAFDTLPQALDAFVRLRDTGKYRLFSVVDLATGKRFHEPHLRRELGEAQPWAQQVQLAQV